MQCFHDVLKDFEEANAQVLGVSVDSWAAQGVYARELGISFPLLSDWPRYETCKAYAIWREDAHLPARVTYVIDKGGIIRGVIESETDMEVHSREALRVVRALEGKA